MSESLRRLARYAEYSRLSSASVTQTGTAVLQRTVATSLWGAPHPPNIERELVLPAAAVLRQMNADVCRGRPFTPDGYAQLLREAIRLYRVGKQYEEAIDVNECCCWCCF